MQLENTFTVPTGIDDAWAAFNDPRRFVPCFPGASLEAGDEDSFVGTVTARLGPISVTYQGKGTYVERDQSAYRVVIDASGRDSQGNGTAIAKVTGTLVADGPDRTTVTMVTDMTVTGRPAQFGRGLLADVSDEIIGRFASCLADKLGARAESGLELSGAALGAVGMGAAWPPGSAFLAPGGSAVRIAAPAAARASTNGASPKLVSVPRPSDSEVDAIDLLDAAGVPVLKRLAPALLGLLLLFVLLRRIKHRND